MNETQYTLPWDWESYTNFSQPYEKREDGVYFYWGYESSWNGYNCLHIRIAVIK